jgi:hypothetical protein
VFAEVNRDSRSGARNSRSSHCAIRENQVVTNSFADRDASRNLGRLDRSEKEFSSGDGSSRNGDTRRTIAPTG